MRGALEVYFLIPLIVGIAGFLVVLFFLYQFNFNGYSEDEVCKLSVLTRATTPGLLDRTGGEVPLKCATRKLCITDSLFGECEQFSGEKKVEKVRISVDEEDADKIEKTVADELLSCWKMMGEGKLDFLGKEWGFLAEEAKPQCVICSRIAIDRDFFDENGEVKLEYRSVLEGVNINEHLKNEIAPESTYSYLELLTDKSTRSYGEFQEKLEQSEGRASSELAVLFAQINTKDEPASAAGTAVSVGLATVGSLILSPVGKLITNPVGIAVSISGITAASAFVYLKASDDQAISTQYCGKFESSENNRKGCSIIALVDYSKADEIKKICSGGILGSQ